MIASATTNILINATTTWCFEVARLPRAQWITGTAIMSALVIVFDYALKFSGVKIPFPMLPTLKFDLDGIPIVMALFLYGPYSALTTCFVAFVAILARSGAALSASMKALAEFGTVLGLLPFYKINPRGFRLFGVASGTLSRIVVMVVATYAAWPLIFQSEQAALAFLPFLAVFNAVAAVISISGGYLVYRALAKRAPALLPTKDRQMQRVAFSATIVHYLIRAAASVESVLTSIRVLSFSRSSNDSLRFSRCENSRSSNLEDV